MGSQPANGVGEQVRTVKKAIYALRDTLPALYEIAETFADDRFGRLVFDDAVDEEELLAFVRLARRRRPGHVLVLTLVSHPPPAADR
jgi:hypothetical protein